VLLTFLVGVVLYHAVTSVAKNLLIGRATSSRTILRHSIPCRFCFCRAPRCVSAKPPEPLDHGLCCLPIAN
jgi:hypothetical protein